MKVIDEILTAVEFNGNFCVIGIDGPTASGKTTLADALINEFKKRKIEYFVYRLDWTLVERSKRLKQFEILCKENEPFEFEADLQMQLGKAKDFLDIIEDERYNESLTGRSIHLNNLYSREDNGKCTGSVKLKLKKKMVILVEGHYTHHRLLRRFFDFNVLLIARPEELLRRKILRIASYRDKGSAKKYFSLIDLPSFYHYYHQNGPYFNKIFLNEKFESQECISHDRLQKTLFKNFKGKPFSPGRTLIPVSSQASAKQIEDVNKFFDALCLLHNKLVQLWGIHPQSRSISFEKQAEIFFKKSAFRLSYSDFYVHKSNEFSYELGFYYKEVCFIISGSLKKIQVLQASVYTHRVFRLGCNTNGLAEGKVFKMIRVKKMQNGEQHIVAPNKFFVPYYFMQYDSLNKNYYDTNEYFWESADVIMSNPAFVVRKINSRDQLDFYNRFFDLVGYKVVSTYGYLFADNLNGKNFTREFDDFCKNLPQITNLSFDETAVHGSDITALEKLGLALSDGQFVLSTDAKINKIIEFYNKASATIKNKITRNLEVNYSDRKVFGDITLQRYICNLPVPLKEFYFSLFISKLGAIPFISLYHAKADSFDLQEYLNFYSKNDKPFGVQASMNALGNGEKENDGYLNTGGPVTLAALIKKNLLSFLSQNPDADLPVWGLGIDHAVHDKNDTGKVYVFIKEAVSSEWFTSYCVDASTFFTQVTGRIPEKEIQNFAEKIFSIIGNQYPDIELYLGNEQVFEKMPMDDSLAIYKKITSCFNKTAAGKNHSDCFLLGPFLGTLHHRLHKNVNLELSEKVFKECIDDGFIGNVLHGTSFTPFDQIRKLIEKNCIRINYAGKLLEAMVQALPADKRKVIGHSQFEWKQNITTLRPEIIRQSKKSIIAGMEKVLKQIDISNSLPVMNEKEKNWFREDHVCLPTEDFGTILKNIQKKTVKVTPEKSKKKHYFLASMIEIPFKEFAGGLAEKIIKAGINHFHIDVGDGNFISRTLDGFEKLDYLRKHYPEVKTHIHLMVSNPFAKEKGTSLISKICKAKPLVIYLNPASFDFMPSWKQEVQLIKKAGSSAGVVFAVDEKMKPGLLLNKLKKAGIHNVLVMGVPLGRGGQNFRYETIDRIIFIKTWAQKNKYEMTIEVDGGLSDDVIPDCIRAGAFYLSGWSMFLKYGVEKIEKRISELLNE